jgi:peptidoglycan/LPS O-acetylase OafA/YrhL
VLISLTCLEFVLGVAELLLVPFSRPNGWIPQRNQLVYLVHAGVGGVLGLGALAVLVLAWQRGRMERFGVLLGLFGIALAAVGGVLSEQHHLRAGGMALMFAGAAVAAFGYMAALVESAPPAVPTSASTAQGDTTS